MLFLKTFKDAKFVLDGNAFQTFITLSLHIVYRAVIVAKLTYAASAWWGYTSAAFTICNNIYNKADSIMK